jgi:hypothetical protein
MPNAEEILSEQIIKKTILSGPYLQWSSRSWKLLIKSREIVSKRNLSSWQGGDGSEEGFGECVGATQATSGFSMRVPPFHTPSLDSTASGLAQYLEKQQSFSGSVGKWCVLLSVVLISLLLLCACFSCQGSPQKTFVKAIQNGARIYE